MARTKISEFSATAADNTDIDSIDIAEGCAPSGINNAIRELMAQLKDFQTGAGGDSFTTANLAYTGTLTGGTGVINIGSGQVYKDASGNVGVGTTTPATILQASFSSSSSGIAIANSIPTLALYDNTGTTGTGYFAQSNTNTYLYNKEAGPLIFGTGNNERARIDSSGNLGLGVTPSAWNSAWKAFQIGPRSAITSGTGDVIDINCNLYRNASNVDVYIASDYASRYRQLSGGHYWSTAPSGTAGNTISFTTTMTLDASGNLLVGTTSNGDGNRVNIVAPASKAVIGVQVGANGNGGINWYNATGGYISSVIVNASSVAYNTTSDYRLKENVRPITGALDRVMQLEPSEWDWKVDGSQGVGFIAHQVQAIRPQAVTGTKDAVDADGKPVYQGMDASFLIADLTAALQELKTEFDAYKAAHP